MFSAVLRGAPCLFDKHYERGCVVRIVLGKTLPRCALAPENRCLVFRDCRVAFRSVSRRCTLGLCVCVNHFPACLAQAVQLTEVFPRCPMPKHSLVQLSQNPVCYRHEVAGQDACRHTDSWTQTLALSLFTTPRTIQVHGSRGKRVVSRVVVRGCARRRRAYFRRQDRPHPRLARDASKV